MSKSVIKKWLFTMFFIGLILLGIGEVNAASISIYPSKNSANVGDSISINVSGNDISGRISLSASGASLSENSIWVDNSSATVTAVVNESGTVNISAVATDAAITSSLDGEKFSGSNSCTIAVSIPQPEPTPEPTQPTTPETPPVEQTKSSNANLSNLGIRPNDFSGFTPGKTTYNVEVPNDVEQIEIYATKQDSKSTILSGIGKKNLNEGKNYLEVVVKAEDGTTKTYAINVTRNEKEEQEETEQENKNEIFGLSELEIKGITLQPEFKTDVYEYKVDLKEEKEKVDIVAYANDNEAIIEITGNENLKEGENTITIIVTDKTGEKVATYQIIVNKVLIDEESIIKENEYLEQQEKNKKLLIVGVVASIIIIVSIIVIIKRKRNKSYGASDFSIPYSDINDDVNDEYEEEYEEQQYDESDIEEEQDLYEDEYEEELVTKKKPKRGKRFK